MAGAGVQLRPTALCVGEQGGSTFLGRVFRRPSLSLQVAAFNTYLHTIYIYLHYIHVEGRERRNSAIRQCHEQPQLIGAKHAIEEPRAGAARFQGQLGMPVRKCSGLRPI